MIILFQIPKVIDTIITMGIFLHLMKQNLQKIIELLGNSQTKFAYVLSNETNKPVKQAHVWKWLNSTKDGIPAEHVIPACKAVDWKVTPNELRPDLYPHPNDGLPSELRTDCSEAA
jgi:DNA-binding transcriptional regulator YdaS (Cro superfamily)